MLILTTTIQAGIPRKQACIWALKASIPENWTRQGVEEILTFFPSTRMGALLWLRRAIWSTARFCREQTVHFSEYERICKQNKNRVLHVMRERENWKEKLKDTSLPFILYYFCLAPSNLPSPAPFLRGAPPLWTNLSEVYFLSRKHLWPCTFNIPGFCLWLKKKMCSGNQLLWPPVTVTILSLLPFISINIIYL